VLFGFSVICGINWFWKWLGESFM